MIGLDTNEIKVFKKLTLNPQSVADLVRKTRMPRMTMYTNLLRLKKKRLAKEIKSETGKRNLWVRNQDSIIEEELSESKEKILGLASKTSKKISVFKGKDEVGDKLMELTVR